MESGFYTYGFVLSNPAGCLCAPGYDLAPLRCNPLSHLYAVNAAYRFNGSALTTTSRRFSLSDNALYNL